MMNIVLRKLPSHQGEISVMQADVSRGKLNVSEGCPLDNLKF